MREKKLDRKKANQGPSKLLNVLVAAGMALGVQAARAQEKPAPSDEKTAAPADQGGDQAAKDKKEKEQAQAKAKAEKEKQKKKAEDEKKASEEGGGVKGW
jgi:hypothetical protein